VVGHTGSTVWPSGSSPPPRGAGESAISGVKKIVTGDIAGGLARHGQVQQRLQARQLAACG